MNFRLFLLPFSLIYGSAVFLRNKLFDFAVFKETKFPVSIISIGNITTGGTGKTPHIEYLLKLLSTDKNVATLSRGYGRKTRGFLYVNKNAKAEIVGDEPLQLKTKFSDAVVSVCESRVIGIEQILKDNPDTSVVLLDDAFQHRQVKAGISILLLDYGKIFKPDFLLPAGNLREQFSSKKRADIIVVTRCPLLLQDSERMKVIEKISATENQKVFFSSMVYAEKIESVFGSDKIALTKNTSTLLVTGIADASGINAYTETKTKLEKHLEFNDHHKFSNADIKSIIEIFSTIAAGNKIILTTEKDAMRMKHEEKLKTLPLYYLPIEVRFPENDAEKFNKLITDYVGKN